jgi:hypothetical protein
MTTPFGFSFGFKWQKSTEGTHKKLSAFKNTTLTLELEFLV